MVDNPEVKAPEGEIQSKLVDGVLTLRIFNPTQGNALTGKMAEQLRQAFKRARETDEIEAVILRGLEGRDRDHDGKGNIKSTFCGGMDLMEVVRLLEKNPAPEQRQQQLEDAVRHCRVFADMFDAMRALGQEKQLIVVSYGKRAPGMAATLMAVGAKHGDVVAAEGVKPDYPETNLGLEAYASVRFVTDLVQHRRSVLEYLDNGDEIPLWKYAGSNMEVLPRSEVEEKVAALLRASRLKRPPVPLSAEQQKQGRIKVLAGLKMLKEEKVVTKELQNEWSIGTKELGDRIRAQSRVIRDLRRLDETQQIEALESRWGVAPQSDLGDADIARYAKVTVLEGLHELGEHELAIQLSSKWLGQQFCKVGAENLRHSLIVSGNKAKEESPAVPSQNPSQSVDVQILKTLPPSPGLSMGGAPPHRAVNGED